MRDSPAYAVSLGVSRFKYQMLVFAASAFFTGLAGAVYAGYFRVMGANTLYLSLLLFLLSMLVVGGLGSAWGPLLGVAALMLVDEALKETAEYRDIGLGAILVIMVMVWPTGLAGAIETLWRRIKETRARRKPASSDIEGSETGLD